MSPKMFGDGNKSILDVTTVDNVDITVADGGGDAFSKIDTEVVLK